MKHSLASEEAQKVVRRGAAIGMVRVQLRKMDVPESEIDGIFKAATRSHTARTRLTGAITLAGGIALAVGSTLFIAIVYSNTNRLSLPAIFAVVFGMLTAGKGLVSLASGVVGGDS